MPKFITATLALTMLVLVGCNGNESETSTNEDGTVPAKKDGFTVAADAFTVKQGEAHTLVVKVDRGEDFKEEVKVTLSGDMKGLTADSTELTFKANEAEKKVVITAADDAEPTKQMIKVAGEGGEKKADVDVEVTTEKKEEEGGDEEPSGDE